MKVMAICRLCGTRANGDLHYHTRTERWRVGCPSCGSFGSAEKRDDAERAFVEHQQAVIDREVRMS